VSLSKIMTESSRHQYLLGRIDKLLSQLPEDVLKQLIQEWELEFLLAQEFEYLFPCSSLSYDQSPITLLNSAFIGEA
jgi:hypothetical protein